MLPRLPRNFATDLLYPDGPKAGELAKQRPDALAAGGIRPGAGAKISAEEMNDLLAHAMRHIRNTRWNFLEDWRSIGAPGAYIGGAARRKTGYTILAGATAAPYNKYSPTANSVTAEASPGSWDTAVSGCCVSDHGFVYVLGFDSGTNEQHGSRISTTAIHSITSSMASSGNGGQMFAAWDEVNNAIVVANTNATDGTSLGYLDTLDLTDALSGGSVVEFYSNRSMDLAAGGGVAMALGVQGADSFCKTSSDGGQTWTDVTSPASGDSTDVFYGLGYTELDGIGPCFICHLYDGTNNGHVIQYSDNAGASWTTVATISELDDAGWIAATNPLNVGRTFFLGDSAIFFAAPGDDNERYRGIRVFDLGEKRGFVVGQDHNAGKEWSLSGVPLVWFDGVRFFAQDVSGDMFVSGAIGIPPVQYGDNSVSRFD